MSISPGDLHFFTWICGIVALLLSYSSLQISALSDGNPHSGVCVMRGICGAEGELKKNCPYDGPPLPYRQNTGWNTTSYRELSGTTSTHHKFRELCPRLFKDVTYGYAEAFCCDADQIEILHEKMAIPQQLLGRCPSCYSNFVDFWCKFTCSPRQGDFVHVTEKASDAHSIGNKAYVTEAEFHIDENYAYALYNSCREVRTGTGDYVLAMMCGTSIEKCSPEKLFKYLGTYNKAIQVPFTINVVMSATSRGKSKSGRVMRPMNETVYGCDQGSDSSPSACSCTDCSAACRDDDPYLTLKDRCKMATMDCSTAMKLIALVILLSTLMVITVSHYVLQRYTAEEEWRRSTSASDGQEVPHLAVNGKEENCLTGDNYFPAVSATTAHIDGEAPPPRVDKLSLSEKLAWASANYGRCIVRHTGALFLIGLAAATCASLGLLSVRLTAEPGELWSSPGRNRDQRDFFNSQFSPFHRIVQFIVVPRDQRPLEREDPRNFHEMVEYGPVFRKSFLEEVFKLYHHVLNLTTVDERNGNAITLHDICYKPLHPDNYHCAIMSLFNYFQNNASHLEREREELVDSYDYMDHLLDCIESPYRLQSRLGLSCLGEFGGPVQPYVVLGDFTTANSSNTKAGGGERPEKFASARGLVVTILINNHVNQSENALALRWESAFIRYISSVRSSVYTVSYMAERSLPDEIERQSVSDTLTVALSYLFMVIYVIFALGQYSIHGDSLCTLFIGSKFIVGLAGISSIVLSVTSSIGVFAMYGMPASLIVLEAEPFLIMAVGVDNIFIIVQRYQQLLADESRLEQEKAAGKRSSLAERISAICSQVVPSMLLTSLCECLCFIFGALSSMPAVQSFSLYAALAIFFQFFLQLTLFLAVFVWDARRQEEGRLEVCCWVRIPVESTSYESYMYRFCKTLYAPMLLGMQSIRYAVMLVFTAWLTSSVLVVNRIKPGLDAKLAVPEDSYLYHHFLNMERFLSVGPPVYFVLKADEGFDFSNERLQNLVCSSGGWGEFSYRSSLGSQIARAARYPAQSYIAQPAMNWLDDYLQWIKPSGATPCCRQFLQNGSFCSPIVSEEEGECTNCDVWLSTASGRPSPARFYTFLANFLGENPSAKCPGAGRAAYRSAVKLNTNTPSAGRYFPSEPPVFASYYVTYHTALRTSGDFILARENARVIAENITKAMNKELVAAGFPTIEVFPYSPFYVYYEQYESIVRVAIIQILLSLGSIFFVTTLLLDPWSAFIVSLTAGIIFMDLVGLMYWWGLDFNAISVVNLVMSVGISVEFLLHIVRAFSISGQQDRVDRATEALSSVGCSILSGITLTKLGGIIVLAFAHSQIINIYYFRMFWGIILIGVAHGLVFLPVLLSFCGPLPSITGIAGTREKTGLAGTMRKESSMARLDDGSMCEETEPALPLHS